MPDTLEQPSTFKRDISVIRLIGSAHFFSHFYQLALAPLFLLLHDSFDVSYVLLGSVVTSFYAGVGACARLLPAFWSIVMGRGGF